MCLSVGLSCMGGSWTHSQARPVQRRGVPSLMHLAWACVGKWVAPEDVGEAAVSGGPGSSP